jgi:hypothetical protein
MPKLKRWRAALIAAAAVAVVVLAVALPLFQPWRLFTDKVVDEALPGAVPISTNSSSTTPPTISGAPSTHPAAAPEILLTGKLITR